MGVGCQRHAAATLPVPQSRSGRVRVNLAPTPGTVQPAASRYTDCAIPTQLQLLFETLLRKLRSNARRIAGSCPGVLSGIYVCIQDTRTFWKLVIKLPNISRQSAQQPSTR